MLEAAGAYNYWILKSKQHWPFSISHPSYTLMTTGPNSESISVSSHTQPAARNSVEQLNLSSQADSCWQPYENDINTKSENNFKKFFMKLYLKLSNKIKKQNNKFINFYQRNSLSYFHENIIFVLQYVKLTLQKVDKIQELQKYNFNSKKQIYIIFDKMTIIQ